MKNKLDMGLEQSIIVNKVWSEMHRIKSWLIQIELYTDRQRHNTKVYSMVVIVSSMICLLCAIANPIIQNNLQQYSYICNWLIGLSSITATITSVIKDFMPQIKQPESELFELDKLHNFYTGFFQKLEVAFILRYDEKSDMNDEKLINEYDNIAKTEGNRQSKMNNLIRGLSKKEKKIIDDQTEQYFQITYKS